MEFSEKLKKLRKDHNMTQEELACKLYVTRTAISKWETGQGYPSIESLKYLSELFHVSIDELVSHEDIANKAAFDKKASQKYYIASIACWIFTVGCALAAYLTGNQYWGIGCGAGIVGYIFFASIFSYKRRRIKAGKELRSFIAIRVAILLVLLAITAGFFFKIG